MTNSLSRKRSATLAALLSAVSPGLGFLYLGKWRLAIAIPLIILLLIGLAGWTRLVLMSNVLLYISSLLLLFYLAVIIASFVMARNNRATLLNTSQRWYFYVLFLVVFLVINQLVQSQRANLLGFEPFKAPSASMANTILPGEYILADTWAYHAMSPSRGDILLFRTSQNQAIIYAKRVIGLPGETVEMVAGQIFIDGNVLSEPYVLPEHNRRTAVMNAFKVQIPENRYFLLGDNRDNSRDSRHFGFVSAHQFYGKAEYIWLSFYADITARTGRGL